MILLVEDHEEIGAALTLVLELEGYKVLHAPSVGVAFGLLRRNQFKLVVSDFNLLDGTGDQVIFEARKRGFPSILITGNGTKQNIADAVNCGASSVILKPFKLHHLLAEVRRVIEAGVLRERAFEFLDEED